MIINVSGEDKPGLTSSIPEILGRHNANILDIGQAVIHNTLSLGILIGFLRRLTHPVFLRSLAYRAGHVLSPRIARAVWRRRGRLGSAHTQRHPES